MVDAQRRGQPGAEPSVRPRGTAPQTVVEMCHHQPIPLLGPVGPEEQQEGHGIGAARYHHDPAAAPGLIGLGDDRGIQVRPGNGHRELVRHLLPTIWARLHGTRGSLS